MTFAEKLKELREGRGLSRDDLALTSGLSRGTIRDYEQGKRHPSLESGFRLADALEVSVEVFKSCVLAGTGAPSADPQPTKTVTPLHKHPKVKAKVGTAKRKGKARVSDRTPEPPMDQLIGKKPHRRKKGA